MKKIAPVVFVDVTRQLPPASSKLRLAIAFGMFTLCFQIVPVNSFAQFIKLLDFDGAGNGASPQGSLISDGTFLYGTTMNGGANNQGTIFKLKLDGTGYTKLRDCAIATGYSPVASLVSDGTFLYGTMAGGGTTNQGTVFKMKLDGSDYINLLEFDGAAKGARPMCSLVLDGGFLYGMTNDGGANGMGAIFKIKTDGTGYAKLLDFAYTATGGYPYGSLLSDGTFLYGMTFAGGIYGTGLGTIFKIETDGTGFTKLLDFDNTNNGESPHGTLISDGTFLYGTTPQGGSGALDAGTIFKIRPDGTSYTKLLVFSGAPNSGQNPFGSLFSDGTFLYGMTRRGGTSDIGVLYRVRTDGADYANLFSFAMTDGFYPVSTPISDGTFLYGMAAYGGTNGMGTIFKYAITPVALPTITNFTPASGPIGTTVIITGKNFSTTPADNTARFNGTLATVTASSATSITTTVPIGASTGTITVTVGGNTATSATSFIVTTSASINFTTQPTNTTLCEGNNAAFSLVASGDTNLNYQWQIDNGGFVNLANSSIYSGVNTANLIISNTLISLNGSIYRCNVMGDNSANTSSGSAVLTVRPLPTAMISSNGTQLIASAGDNYQWYQNDVAISGATNQVLELMSVLEYGVYAVDVSVNGCIRTSIDFEYLITKNETQAHGWKIYPNPFTTTLSIEPSTTEAMEIEIVDVLGRSVKRIPEFNSDTIFLNELQEGSYFLTIHTARQSAHFRIIKAH